MTEKEIITEARMRLVETGGRTSQDLGAGRIVGQVLVYMYLQEAECSLDQIGDDLGLSKASVSIAARQLEQLGLARKMWKKGDRKNYFKSADNIANALQHGMLSLVRKKMRMFGDELDGASKLLEMLPALENGRKNTEVIFLEQRITRAGKLQRRLDKVINNPIVRMLSESK